MAAYLACLLMLWLTASSCSGLEITTTAPDFHVPREPRDHQPSPPLHHPPAVQGPQQPLGQPAIPPHAAALDKQAQPILPRDTDVSGIACINDTTCTASSMGENSECRGSTCHCKTGATLSSSSNRCLTESVLGGGCAEDWQCSRPLGNTVTCKNNYCTCVDGAVIVKGKCYQQKKLSDGCSNLEECLKGVNTECADSRCVCKSAMVPAGSKDKCLPKAVNPSDPCEEDIQCTEPLTSGAACVNGKCICQDSYHFKNHICMKNLKIGAPCGVGIDGDCFLLHDQGINHVDCVDSKCQCRDSRVPSADGEKCLSPDQKDDGSGGGADSLQPLLLTLATMLLARFLLS
ncbi:prion-like-(Q/N-rich) domain-bearing protein 25 [Ischnura elegans]|uniref:prion-like-(Q/N-rich) domain-bearing protein 25 n=1 Tax=Ischnura elegans TaxID=197161 RepID=UPI001ED8AC0C|nr:prion-like-(Q/N-rich) domain-bearing protein 25 [Ischnura elegans]